MIKLCTKCNIEKEIELFVKDKRLTSGYISTCLDCKRIMNNKHNQKYRSNNREICKQRSKEYRDNNVIKEKTRSTEYRNKNRNELNNKKCAYYHLNKLDISLKNKLNRKILNERQRIYKANRKIVDPLYKLSLNIRSLIIINIKKQGYSKKSKTHEILGCSFEEFKLYLESKFEPWMNWDNHGKYNGEFNYGWDIDHIIPLSSAKTKEEILKLSHYTNLQPLCSYTNRYIKTNNI